MKSKNPAQAVRMKICALWLLLAAMIVYMVLAGTWGWGDPRKVTQSFKSIGTILFFGTMVWTCRRIWVNQKRLEHPERLEKGKKFSLKHFFGNLLTAALLFAVITSSMLNDAAFIAFGLLLLSDAAVRLYFAHRKT